MGWIFGEGWMGIGGDGMDDGDGDGWGWGWGINHNNGGFQSLAQLLGSCCDCTTIGEIVLRMDGIGWRIRLVEWRGVRRGERDAGPN